MIEPEGFHDARLVFVTNGEDEPPAHPGLVLCVTADLVEAWLGAPYLPLGLRKARTHGAVVACAPEAPARVRSLTRRLQARMRGTTPASLVEIALDLGLESLAQALRTWPSESARTFAAFSAAQLTGRAPDPQLRSASHLPMDTAARLLLALEHL